MAFKLPKVPKLSIPQVAGGLIGGLSPLGAAGAIGGVMLGSELSKSPSAPNLQEDPRLTELRQRMQTQAQDFRSQAPELQKEQQGLLKNDAESTIESGTRDIRGNYNRRGLLYSGYRQGAETGLKGRVASQLSKSIASSNKEIEDLARAKEDAAAAVGLQSYDDMLKRADMLYDTRMENSIARRQALQQIGSGIGYAAGSAYGSSSKQPSMPQYSIPRGSEYELDSRYNPYQQRGLLS